MSEPLLEIQGDVLSVTIGDKVGKVKIPKERGPAGRDGISIKGDKGERGDRGEPGRDSCIPGPKGDKGDCGETGSRGLCPNISIGQVVCGDLPAVILGGIPEYPVLNFVVPRGEKGDRGSAGLNGKNGSHESIDLFYAGHSPRFTSEWISKHVLADGMVECPEMRDDDIGSWFIVKSFTSMTVAGLVEDAVHLGKGEAGKFVVISVGGKSKFTRF
jgi:hypothetical protein